MEASSANITSVRESLGESIPTGGTDADTMFTDARIKVWLEEASHSDAASYRGWLAKLANLSDLVNVSDGAASRELSDAYDHAMQMVKLYGKLAQGPSAGRSRVGKIIRP